MAEAEDGQPPVLHVVVIGFHHKRGCQVGGVKKFPSGKLILFYIIFDF